MNNDNFFLAVVLSIGILVGFHYFYEKPQMDRYQREQALVAQQADAKKKNPETEIKPVVLRPRAEILAETPRVQIETPAVKGSINLKGGRLDDLSLRHYRETTDPASPAIVLFSPSGSEAPHRATYASFGWLGDAGVVVPGDDTVWSADKGAKLTPRAPVILRWDNGHGLIFEREIAVDDHFMFTITDRVRNKENAAVTLYPYGSVARHGRPEVAGTYVLHEGPLGVLDGTLKEVKYKDMEGAAPESFESQGGWIGITDKFWLMTLIPDQNDKITGTFSFALPPGEKNVANGIYQTDFRGGAVTIEAGSTIAHVQRLFAGAKQVRLLDSYASQLQLPLFDRAIDFGWYYYLTKPFLYLLDYMGQATGNYGIAIMLLTILVKLLALPMSMKSYRSMARMRALQPEINAIQKRFGDDRAAAGLATMELYKREKVNPMSGCLPNLIQIPIFFALYKVLYVGIELRQAPLFGWIHDLSAPDPSSVLTLFGAIDWPFIPHLGVWPIIMGLSMYLQQRMSPQPADKSQANMFKFLPLIFTFMMSKVAVGLIFYWAWSNLIGSAQQALIIRRMSPPSKKAA